MNNRNSLEELATEFSFDEKIDILFNEIDLAIKWSRPSILFAIYSSGSILSKAKAELEDRLSNLNQKTHIIEISGKKQSNFSTDIFKLPQLSHSVLFIDDIKSVCDDDNACFFKELKRSIEKFIDHRIRVVFWLPEEEVPSFAINAIECWILRHRVVEFQDSPLETNVLLETLESTWMGLEKNALLDPSSSLAISEILKSPENVEPNFFHGNLLLMLGILYWRKGKSKDALRFLNAALDIGKHISHQKLEAQCNDALALVQSDPKNTVDKITVSRQVIPLSLNLEDSQPESAQPGNPRSGFESSGKCKENQVIDLEQQERGVKMKESDHIFDHKTSVEWNELGNKFLRAGSYNDAINAFTKAIELAPDLNWPYIRNLASAHYYKGKIKGKLNTGKIDDPDVWETDDEDMEPITYFNQEDLPPAKRADNYEEEGNNKHAISEKPIVENVVSCVQANLSVDGPDALKNSVKNEQQSLSSHIAIPTKEQSVKRDTVRNIPVGSNSLRLDSMTVPQVDGTKPQSAFDWNELGNSFTSAGDYEKAIAAYKKSIEMDPRFGQPYSNLGFVLYHTGKFQNAALLLTRGLEFLDTPEDKALSWNRLGDVYRRMRDYGNALVAYQKASQLKPDTNPVLARARLSLMDSVAVG